MVLLLLQKCTHFSDFSYSSFKFWRSSHWRIKGFEQYGTFGYKHSAVHAGKCSSEKKDVYYHLSILYFYCCLLACSFACITLRSYIRALKLHPDTLKLTLLFYTSHYPWYQHRTSYPQMFTMNFLSAETNSMNMGTIDIFTHVFFLDELLFLISHLLWIVFRLDQI